MLGDNENLKSHLRDYVLSITEPDRGRNMFKCPLCKSGKSGKRNSDGAFSITPDGERWKCFSCDQGGDLFDLIGAYEGLSEYKDQAKRATELYGSAQPVKVKKDPEPTGKAAEEFVNYVNDAQTSIFGSLGESYLKERGIVPETIKSLKIGYDEARNGIVIPYPGKTYYTLRFIQPIGDHKYDKPSAEKYGQEPLFLLGDPKKDTLFICEGQIDAITLWQSGAGAAAAIGGTGYQKLEKLKIKNAVYVMDNDEPGQKAAENVKGILEKQGANFIIVSAPDGFKDVNEAWVKNPDSITKLIIDSDLEVRALEVPDNVSEYLENTFTADIEQFQKYKDLKTGYGNLDSVQNFYPGFYVIGAISSLGKTTFTHQLADQVAESGKPVIIFSLEQNKLELVSKGLSRTIAKNTRTNEKRLTAIEIRRGLSNDELLKAVKEYGAATKNEYIVEGGFNTTMKDIEDYVKEFMAEHEQKPVVIVDYLQIIQPDDPRQGTKESVDNHVRALKNLQSKNELVLIAISSLNRCNYIAPVDFESFKETGAIEYTADVVWGLQLACLTENDIFTKPNKIIEKRQAISDAMLKNPRQVELVCLKNRYGKSRYKCSFSYFPAYDHFISNDEFRYISEEEEKDLKDFAEALKKNHPPRQII